MPAVKSLHQESGNNSKAEFIMGHSFQAVSLLADSPSGQVFAIPLISRICEGLVRRRLKNPRTLLDKLVSLFMDVVQAADVRAILVADAYYATDWRMEGDAQPEALERRRRRAPPAPPARAAAAAH